MLGSTGVFFFAFSVCDTAKTNFTDSLFVLYLILLAVSIGKRPPYVSRSLASIFFDTYHNSASLFYWLPILPNYDMIIRTNQN